VTEAGSAARCIYIRNVWFHNDSQVAVVVRELCQFVGPFARCGKCYSNCDCSCCAAVLGAAVLGALYWLARWMVWLWIAVGGFMQGSVC
jgi:hypothetical protein